MIVITGARELAGISLISKLNEEGFNDLVLVDNFSKEEKDKLLNGKKYSHKVNFKNLPEFIRENHIHIQFIYHLSDNVVEKSFFENLWSLSIEFGLFLVFKVNEGLNNWINSQDVKPYFWAGFAVPELYGSIECEDQNPSVIKRIVKALEEKGNIEATKLTEIEKTNILYIQDFVEVLYFFLHNRKNAGYYSITGEEITNETLETIIKARHDSSFCPPSEEPTTSLKDIGFTKSFHSLKEGMQNYLHGRNLKKKQTL